MISITNEESEMAFLKADFEHCNVEKLGGALMDEGWDVICGDQHAQFIIVDTDEKPAKLRDFVWKHNGGLSCTVSELTEDELEEYL
jgi:hypothetical protein